jgi:hypothetical protein
MLQVAQVLRGVHGAGLSDAGGGINVLNLFMAQQVIELVRLQSEADVSEVSNPGRVNATPCGFSKDSRLLGILVDRDRSFWSSPQIGHGRPEQPVTLS